MSRSHPMKPRKDPRVSEVERYYNNRPSGGWKACGSGPLPFPAGKDGQGQFHSLDMWGKGVPDYLRDAAQPRPEGVGDESSGLVSDTYQHANVLIIYEGAGLVQLKCPSLRKNLKQPQRGEITEFSYGSARRFRIILAKVSNEAFEQAMLLTMTYPAELHEKLKNWRLYKAHLKAYWIAFLRKFPEASGFWKLEFQENGRPHYHCVVFELGFARSRGKLWEFRKWHAKTWARVVGSSLEKHEKAGTKAEYPRRIEGSRGYISKYTGKQEQQCGGYAGRYWGYVNKKSIPFVVASEYSLTDLQAVRINRVKRKLVEKQVNARRLKKALEKSSEKGERGWTPLSLDYGRTLKGKAGDAVKLSSEKFKGATIDGETVRNGIFTTVGGWHHFWPKGATLGDVLKGECGVVSKAMRPLNFKAPRKFKARANHSATYLGDATKVGAQILEYLTLFDPQPDYRRPEGRKISNRSLCTAQNSSPL